MRKLKIGDIIVTALLILTTAGMIFFGSLSEKDGQNVVISAGGNESVYNLSEDRELEVEGKGVRLHIVIKNGSVSVRESSCPGQNCVNMGEISKKGQTIACVPGEVFIKISGEDGGGYDHIIG